MTLDAVALTALIAAACAIVLGTPVAVVVTRQVNAEAARRSRLDAWGHPEHAGCRCDVPSFDDWTRENVKIETVKR